MSQIQHAQSTYTPRQLSGAALRTFFNIAEAWKLTVDQQRELLGASQEALDRIAAPLPTALEEERQLLQAQLMMARQDHAGAAALLQGLKGSPSAGLYARFNLGVALIRAGKGSLEPFGLEA